MSTLRVDQIVNGVGTGKPNFPSGLQISGSDVNVLNESDWEAGTSQSESVFSPAKLRSALNASGSAPIYACRAWVNFDGTGTVSIRGSGNVSSVTDNGTGDYTVNFEVAMPDTNYNFVGAANSDNDNHRVNVQQQPSRSTRTTTECQIVVTTGNSATARQDTDAICVSFFR